MTAETQVDPGNGGEFAEKCGAVPNMLLNEEAMALKRQFLAQATPEVAQCAEAAMAEIKSLHPAGQVLGTGALAPDFERREIQGGRVRLSHLLREGPVILVFYRGSWCPFCNLGLRAWQHNIERVRGLGGEVLAVAPEAADSARAGARHNGLDFPIVTDANQEVAARYGVLFELPPAARELQTLLDAPLDRLNADGTWRLPVPATFVIDTHQVIRWSHAHDDYSRRAEPREVLDALEPLGTSLTEPSPAHQQV